MIRILFTLALFFGCLVAVYAQRKPVKDLTSEDVVFLKNGWELHGNIMDPDSAGRLRVKIAGGSIFAFPPEDVLKMEHRESEYMQWLKQPRHIPQAKTMYCAMDFTLRPMAKFSVGWRPTADIDLGAGAGVSLQLLNTDNVPALMPIFAEARWRFINTPRHAPFVYAAGGYTQPLFHSQNADWSQGPMAQGHEYLEGAVGMQFFTRSKVSYTLSLGWKHQRVTQDAVVGWTGGNWWWGGGGTPVMGKQTNTISRLSASFGFCF